MRISYKAFCLICFQIYFASEEYGLDSTVTCGGYFLMADVFVKKGEPAIVHSLYKEVRCQTTLMLLPE